MTKEMVCRFKDRIKQSEVTLNSCFEIIGDLFIKPWYVLPSYPAHNELQVTQLVYVLCPLPHVRVMGTYWSREKPDIISHFQMDQHLNGEPTRGTDERCCCRHHRP